MLSKTFVSFVALSVLSLSKQASARYRWLERDGHAILLHPRRFDQENPAVISELSSACEGQVCGVLSGQAISTLLAAADECAQQDMADQIIDAAQQFDDTTKQNMINLAITFRQAEKNTPPDFSVQPNINRNSVFCQKAPNNTELNGLVQAQDPANDPDVFFDPATSSSVQKGAQANTFPFGTNDNTTTTSNSTSIASSDSTDSSVSARLAKRASSVDCATSSAVTVSVTSAAVDAADTGCPSDVTVTVSANNAAATATSTATTSSSDIGDFGSCSTPQIEFGVGFDSRTETSFQPVDQTSFSHGSADNIDVITQAICDDLTNTCGADATAKATCATASQAADGAAKGTGAQADAFNAVFGLQTDFASVAVISNTGSTIQAGVASATAAADNAAATASTTASTTDTAADSTTVSTTAANAAATASSTASASSIGDFGSCTVPQIQFATGFDNRKETSFEPVDQTSYNHGSADNIDIITQFMCDTLTNSCGADATAKATCATASQAADGQTAKTGAQADAFNAVFGIQTDFAAVAEVDDQGNTVAAGSGSAATTDAAETSSAVAATTTPVAAAAVATTSAAAATASASSTSAASGSNLQTFTGNLGGVTAPVVTDLGNGQFQVEGNSAFNSLQNALERSCDVQHNQCANAANASGNSGDLTVDACGTQQTQCDSSAQSAASSA